jgi:hypothetical protein
MFIAAMAAFLIGLAWLCLLTWSWRSWHSQFSKQMQSLAEDIRKLEKDMTERMETKTSVSLAEVRQLQAVPAKSVHPDSTEIKPETEAAIMATLSALLGHQVRIRSVKVVDTPNAHRNWVTQGRIAVQSSHNQRPGRG